VSVKKFFGIGVTCVRFQDDVILMDHTHCTTRNPLGAHLLSQEPLTRLSRRTGCMHRYDGKSRQSSQASVGNLRH